MANYGGFGVRSGPSGPPREKPQFGNPHNSTSPPPPQFGFPNIAPPPAAAISEQNGAFLGNGAIVSPPKNGQSPMLSFGANPSSGALPFSFDEAGRDTIYQSRLDNQSNLLEKNASSRNQEKPSVSLHNIDSEGAKAKIVNSQNPKRTRSPPPLYDDDILLGNSYSTEVETEREMQAKAKRLARFSVELSQPAQSNHDNTKAKFSGNKSNQASVERNKFISEQPVEGSGASILTDYVRPDSSSAIIGLCPDMCPDSEREERERKGDLDKYERLDGDRNQTSKLLAVKKYNRMAEREAVLIRPMPVLQKTMDYLLALLDQPYDDSFLGMYNFLWDRMRAIRMDLRMQHIFNHDAVTMLEQMIRLHVIAMHELCEYKKGEGFSEGFDAHLNIEQMNKTSVELFQIYDDHKKNGISVFSEKEIRVYYALLKLDKHPGYKLRTQALASLHGGLQFNQGIPISHVTKWIAMEEEGIESLLEYHGFLIKDFEEPYMVKEGPFLNIDKDYPTKCSKLVHLKKSKKIIEDVLHCDKLVQPVALAKQDFFAKIEKHKPDLLPVVNAKKIVHADEEMIDNEVLVDDSRVPPVSELRQRVKIINPAAEVGLTPRNAPPVYHFPQPVPAKVGTVSQITHETVCNNSLENGMVGQVTHKTIRNNSFVKKIQSSTLHTPQETVSGTAREIDSANGSYFESVPVSSAPQSVVIGSPGPAERTMSLQNIEEEDAAIAQENEYEEGIETQQKNEAAMAKLKLILRLWKRRSWKLRELREHRQLAASAALSSLSLGPPIGIINTGLRHVSELDIDDAMRERRKRQARSWSRLNVSSVIAEILSKRNPDARCLCWKLIVCSKTKSTEDRSGCRNQVDSLGGQWLSSKLMGARNKLDDELEFSSPSLSIWKHWVNSNHGISSTLCLSVIRERECNEPEDTASGASGVLFLVTERVALELQKNRLHDVVMSLPSGSQLPLLVVSDKYQGDMLAPPTTIVEGLGLRFIDKTRISSFTVVSLVENNSPGHMDGFFSNDRLVEGLQWLASESPVQPVLRCVKTRDLVMNHLNSSLELLESTDASIVGPNNCISAFNEALKRSSEEVADAADKNPTMWPCPEINMLKERTFEHKVVQSFLPSIGWSSPVVIKLIGNAIQGCMLPFFSEDLSWLSVASDMGTEIHDQKSELEKCLVSYLVDSAKMMDWALAAREASVMLQTRARPELQGQKYRIVPRWVAIFRRIFHWRLIKLTSEAPSVAYILEDDGKFMKPCEVTPVKFDAREHSATSPPPNLQISENMSIEGGKRPVLPQMSLDEMLEVCCTPIVSWREPSGLRDIRPLSNLSNKLYEAWDVARAHENTKDDGRQPVNGSSAESDDAFLPNGHLWKGETAMVDFTEKKESDKLQKLLARCNMLQDMIDEKLSIYF
ncbi:hypothetical protein Syun_007735 [Stephania yunnanensis]|uniref:SAC3/GANP/THP3 conserved domain-containing protein n=1 Tax=Stephania yunnanensis TaxID=152371 RepID=A0AAP0Q0I7_9MAGN